MRFLLDENLAASTARALRDAGHDVVAVQEAQPGIGDEDVIALARREDRLLVTFDSDIGERLFLHGDPPPPGVVYLRFVQTSPDETARILLSLLSGRDAVSGFYTTYRGGLVRRSALPPGA